jgi:hypothetical protein
MSTIRDGRKTGVPWKHNLLWTTKLREHKVVLQSVDNKRQLVKIIFEELTDYSINSSQGHTDWS